MKRTFIFTVLITAMLSCSRETPEEPLMYFPPSGTTEWKALTPEELGWNTAGLNGLYDFLESTGTRAFLVLKDGKIVIEQYFGDQLTGQPFTALNYWYWASAGKTLTSMLVGIAQEEGYIDISDKTSDYLGTGWSSLTSAQEDKITVRHHLTMTTGLDDGVTDNHCFEPSCLVYSAEAGMLWAYHNAPYTLLDEVISTATAMSFETYFNIRLRDKAGMDGFWTWVDNDHIYWSTPRSAARFGLLILNKGKWDQTPVISDNTYFTQMITTSQSINPSYGYLWWLNGKGKHMIPQSQIVFQSDITPSAPDDMVAAMGKNGQLINVIPTENLVVVRMGDNPDGYLVPTGYQEDLWKKLSLIVK
jgi:CubicO group peptidase (beta-lactamase class C family)